MPYTPLWKRDLQPANWRGLPIVVDQIATRTGRRTAVHEYPYRDMPWVEDLGLGLQEIAVQGYLLGDDVAAQAAEMRAAIEQPGPGEFVHPRTGSVTVSVVSASFGESKEAANIVGLTLVFLVTQTESSTTLWPVARATSLSSITDTVAGLTSASQGDFLSSLTDTVRAGKATVDSVVSTARGYVQDAQAVVSDATLAVNTVGGIGRQLGIPGLNFSRYLAPLIRATAGLTQISSGLSTVTRVGNTTTSLLASATAARANVTAAVALT